MVSIIGSKHPFKMLVSSSAPSLPSPASFSDRAVKPEMSADSNVPSIWIQAGPSTGGSHDATRWGTYDARVATESSNALSATGHHTRQPSLQGESSGVGACAVDR